MRRMSGGVRRIGQLALRIWRPEKHCEQSPRQHQRHECEEDDAVAQCVRGAPPEEGVEREWDFPDAAEECDFDGDVDEGRECVHNDEGRHAAVIAPTRLEFEAERFLEWVEDFETDEQDR